MSFAARNGFITRAHIPTLELGKEPFNKRPAFSNDELSILVLKAELRIAEVARHPNIHYERQVLLCYILIAIDTGMRPTELYNLRWAHIVGFLEDRKKPIANRRLRILAYGKGKQPQELVPNVGVFGAFEDLWDAYSKAHGVAPKPTDPVFCNVEGSQLGSIRIA